MKKILVLLLAMSFIFAACASAPIEPLPQEEGQGGPSPTRVSDEDVVAYPAPSTGDSVSISNPAYPAPGGGDQGGASGEINFAPQPGDAKLERGNVYIEGSELLQLESYPVQVRLHIWGTLPTPCNELRAVVDEADSKGVIRVTVYSVSDPNAMCTQVVVPFDVTIPLGDFTQGKFSVALNGEEIGVLDFNTP